MQELDLLLSAGVLFVRCDRSECLVHRPLCLNSLCVCSQWAMSSLRTAIDFLILSLVSTLVPNMSQRWMRNVEKEAVKENNGENRKKERKIKRERERERRECEGEEMTG